VSLTTGRGPLSGDPLGRFSAPVPSPIVYVEPYPRRVRARIGGRTVIDTERAKLVHRPGSPPAYSFPADDVPPGLGTPDPHVAGHVAVAWTSVDTWFEESVALTDQHYPKNPYHRVDCLPTNRRLRVELGGLVLADTTETMAVFETALRPCLYVAKAAVRMDLLTPSRSTAWCSYKGRATWWNATIDGVTTLDVAWSYEEPLAESAPLRGLLGFDERQATVVAEFGPDRCGNEDAGS
jgi:uncharacterized protein (DUF427 family)